MKVIVLGFGFMGRLHSRCYMANAEAEVAAVVDAAPDKASEHAGELGLEGVPLFSLLEDALAQVEADAVDICLPTDAHPRAAEQAFAAGLHVFCEKPIALDLEAARRMTLAADRAERQLMIGHCLRFWPEYLALKEMIDSGEAGKVRALNFFRRAPRPGYTVGNWISDPERCVGAALDFHIHDTDLVHFLLGTPAAVFSQGVRLPTGWDHIQTQYLFERGPQVMAEGGWTYPESRPFQMGYCALFENGSLDFDTAAPEPLLKNVGGERIDIALASRTEPRDALAGFEGYRNELDYFVERINANLPVEISTGADATASLRTILAEIESAKSRQPVSLNS
jgi:predicted dehydrogenase